MAFAAESLKSLVYLVGDQADGLWPQLEGGDDSAGNERAHVAVRNAEALTLALNSCVFSPVHCPIAVTQYQTAVKG